MNRENYRVLSIQSHVVSGYVGNKSATFPLQVLGFEVDAVNSVQFSNHTGYKHWKGQVLNAEDLDELFMGLKLNNLHHYTHLLTGYVRSLSFLQKVTETVKQLKEINPNLLYVCDPVMGDNGEMYVPSELLPEFRDNLTPLADVVTPNQLEAELLTGMKISNEEDALKAMQILHDRGIKTVIITSSDLASKDELLNLGSCIKDGKRTAVKLKISRIPANFLGTGDLYTALLSAWLTKSNFNLKEACEKTMSTLQDILKRTYKWAVEASGPNQSPTVAQLELKLIQSKDDIENPKTSCIAEIIS
ncbi:pyridoxal kinase-like isoform X3 [Centruroides sculpturatus]|uniref:pyridoxal kinase-like isoform X3 n=1 Tax=Centruroides sculpturatus TaxID=218467 RepID=UPI000C6E3206|nr:pyridoxal kinase-like isoform X3 [Centruroides sculpturatus]